MLGDSPNDSNSHLTFHWRSASIEDGAQIPMLRFYAQQVLCAQYINGVGPSCLFSVPFYATQIAVKQPIVSNITSVPHVSNQIGYSQMVFLQPD